MKDLKAGVYRHYKGPLYLVLGLAHDANADNLAPADNAGRPIGGALEERTVVVYIGLELDGAHTGPRLAVRTYDDFFALVHSDGTRCEGEVCVRQYDGQGATCDLRRFTYVGPTWEGQS